MNVLIAGGGTAGHVSPAIALGRRLAADGHDVRFVGTATGPEASLVPAAGFGLTVVDARPFVRAISPRALVGPLTAVRSVAQSRPLVESAEVIVGMGGYVSVPVGLAAIRSRRPLVLHEQNAVPGVANRVLARRARAVALTFPDAAGMFARSVRTVVTGNPVREGILRVRDERDVIRKRAFAELDLDEKRRTVAVLGGSQGALHVNEATLDVVHRLQGRADLQVLFQTGPAHLDRVARLLPTDGRLLVRPVGFLASIELAYGLADLAVARAGANTVTELAVCGLPAILVPYPYATGRHQEANARALERVGAARVLLDHAIDGGSLASAILALVDDPERLARMSECALAWSRPDAADSLAALVRAAGGAA
jgi:UDP-N-acetylglucosamine--N-acetylmuramyl-(pentapeptide) pyrophosphoryl-undecaprenol N-acetylglucosamine transferase